MKINLNYSKRFCFQFGPYDYDSFKENYVAGDDN